MKSKGILFIIFGLITLYGVFDLSFVQAQTLEDIIFSDTRFKNFKLSPSGEKVFFKGKDGEVYKGIVYDLYSGAIDSMFDIPDDLDDTEIFWLNDDELVLGAVGNVYKVSLTKQTTRAIFKKNYIWDREFRDFDINRWYVKAVKPNGHLILAMRWRENTKFHSTLFEHDPNLQKTKSITDEKLDVHHWLVTKQGEIRVAVKHGKDFKSYHTFQDGQLKPVVAPNGQPLIEYFFDESKNTYYFQSVSEDSDSLYLTEIRDHNTSRVIAINPNTGQLVTVVKESREVDLGVKNCNFSFHSHPVSGRVVGYSYFNQKLETQWADKQFENIQHHIDALLAGRDNDIRECNSAVEYCLVNSKIKGLASTYLYDVKKEKINLVATEKPEITAENIFGQKVIALKSDSGRNIIAHYTASTIAHPNGKRKVVFIPCGYLDYPTNDSFYTYENYFSLSGYDVVNIATAGCRGNGNADVYNTKNLIEETQNDIGTVVSALLKQNAFKNSDLYFFSDTEFGSLNAVLYSEKNSANVSAISTFTLPVDLYALYKWNEGEKKRVRNYCSDIKYYGNRLSLLLNSYDSVDGLVFKQYSLLEKAKFMVVPLLVATGKDDKTPIRKNIKKFVKRRADKLQWLDIEDTDECICDPESKSAFAKRTLEFFNKI